MKKCIITIKKLDTNKQYKIKPDMRTINPFNYVTRDELMFEEEYNMNTYLPTIKTQEPQLKKVYKY